MTENRTDGNARHEREDAAQRRREAAESRGATMPPAGTEDGMVRR